MLNQLFNPESWVVMGASKYEVVSKQVRDLPEDKSDYQFIAINEFRPGTTRADRNVLEYRNFLLEFDDLSLVDQEKMIKDMKIPYLTQVYSGSKSYHCIISLSDPCKDEDEYRRLVKWIYAAVPGVDKMCKNPSRFTRIVGGVNTRTGNTQTLHSRGKRVTKKDLILWLESKCDEPVDENRNRLDLLSEDFHSIQKQGIRAKLHGATEKFIKTGGRKGVRHRNLYIASCNLRDCFYTEEEATLLLMHKINRIYKSEQRPREDYELKLRCIEDAFNHAPIVDWDSLEQLAR